MNVDQEADYPWLASEKSLIRAAIEAGKYVIGVCLGAQLIAQVLGAEVRQAAHKEIGWFPIHPSADCPAVLQLPDGLRVLHWHGDTFTLPAGARPIASSAACQNQGFLYQDRVLALQCHLEMTPQALALLVAACSNELRDAPYVQSAPGILAEPATSYSRMQTVLFERLDAWLASGEGVPR